MINNSISDAVTCGRHARSNYSKTPNRTQCVRLHWMDAIISKLSAQTMALPIEVHLTTKKASEPCQAESQRQCLDGACIPRLELCPEEKMMNQDTILIMIGVGLGVILFLILMYCLQQRRNANSTQQEVNVDETDYPELLMPPPGYDEAVDVQLYPPTPEAQRHRRISFEEPVTPPPNYDAALHILAQSHENIFSSKEADNPSPPLRRAISVGTLGLNRYRPMTFSSFGANSKTFKKTLDQSKA